MHKYIHIAFIHKYIHAFTHIYTYNRHIHKCLHTYCILSVGNGTEEIVENLRYSIFCQSYVFLVVPERFFYPYPPAGPRSQSNAISLG